MAKKLSIPPILEQQYEQVAVDLIKPHSRNVNQGDAGKIYQSIQDNGFYGACLVQRSTRLILAGSHRWQAAKQAGLPAVPVIWAECDDDAALRIMLSDNATARAGNDNPNALAELLAELAGTENGLAGTGFDGDALDELLADLERAGQSPVSNANTEIPETAPALCQAGDVWALGEHRLHCRNSAGFAAPENSALFFDPPWEIDTPDFAEFATALVFTDGQFCGQAIDKFGSPAWVFVWDCVTSWFAPNRPLKRMKLCLWYGEVADYNADGSHFGEVAKSKRVKNTRGEYDYEADNRGKHLSDVFQLSLPQFHHDGLHKHEKPLDWVRLLLANCTGGDVYDPYAGSGTSLIAAQQIGRRWTGCEIDPQTCDIILERWRVFTGQSAEKTD